MNRIITKIENLKLSLIIALLLTVNSIHAQEIFHPYTDPDNTGNWGLNEEVSDEFDGTEVDKSKWFVLGQDGDYRNHWKGRAPSQFTSTNVSVADGFLSITSKWDEGFDFADEVNNGYTYGDPAPITTGALIAEKSFHYGYMEIRCQAADGPISSSFWSTGPDGELDVFEHFGENPKKSQSAKKYHTSFHDWRSGSPTQGKRIWTNEHILDFRVADDYHIYGFEWDENYIKIFVDGKLIRCVTKVEIGDAWVVNNPQKIWLDSETFNWEVNPTTITPEDFPGDGRTYIIDYVRIWQRTGDRESCMAQTNLISNPGLEDESTGWTLSGDAMYTTEDVFEGEGALKLNGKGEAKQVVDLKTNTSYILSAWIKLPGTNMSNVWHNAYIGVNNYSGENKSLQYFRPDYAYQSIQFKTGDTDESVTVFFKNSQAAHIAYADNFSLIELEDLSGNDIPSSVDEKGVALIARDSINVFPNPAREYVLINGLDQDVYQVVIYNAQGKECLQLSMDLNTNNKISIAELPYGVYVINIQSQNMNESIKFNKIR